MFVGPTEGLVVLHIAQKVSKSVANITVQSCGHSQPVKGQVQCKIFCSLNEIVYPCNAQNNNFYNSIMLC